MLAVEADPNPSPSSEAVVLLSGGMDSAACVYLLKRSGRAVRALFLDYGQAAAVPERRAAAWVAQHLEVPLSEFSFSGAPCFGSGELTGRNAFFVFSALFLGRLGRGVVVLGVHAGTPYFDCSPAFVEAADRLVAEHTDGRVRLVAPLLTWTKADVLDYCRTVGLPLDRTYSCEAGSEPVCGVCASCRDRAALLC